MYFSFHFNVKQLIFLFLLSIFFVLLIINYKTISIPSNTNNMEFKVVIDAGHGSIDTGTSYGNILEKEINLQIAKYLYDELKKVNIIPIMTRNEDKLYQNSRNKDLRQRPIVANQSNANIFISIHANNYPSSQPGGSQIFYKINSIESKKLAENIQNEMIKIRNKNNRSLQRGDYYVLNKINCPGILIEVGFLSNPVDRQILTKPEEQKKISTAIKDGVIQYFQDNFSKQRDSSSKNLGKIENTKNETSVIKNEKNILYFIDNTDNMLYLIKNNMSFPTGNFFDEKYSNLNFTEILAISAVEQLLKPPEGLISPFADKTKINTLSIDNGIVTLDLSQDAVNNFMGGSSMEYQTIEAITKTLISIKGINGVKILVDGKSGESLGGHVILDHVFYK